MILFENCQTRAAGINPSTSRVRSESDKALDGRDEGNDAFCSQTPPDCSTWNNFQWFGGLREHSLGNGNANSIRQQPRRLCEVFQQLAGLRESADTHQIVPRGTISGAWSGYQESTVRNAKRNSALRQQPPPGLPASNFSSLQVCGICAIVPRGTISSACSGDPTAKAGYLLSISGVLKVCGISRRPRNCSTWNNFPSSGQFSR